MTAACFPIRPRTPEPTLTHLIENRHHPYLSVAIWLELESDVTGDTETGAVLYGERFAQYCDDVEEVNPTLSTPFGYSAWVVDETNRDLWSRHTPRSHVKTFEIETAGGRFLSPDKALGMLLGASDVEAIAELVARPVQPWHSNDVITVDNVDPLDCLSLRTVHITRDGQSCLLDLCLVIHREWLISTWHGPCDLDGLPLSLEHRVLPGSRVSSGITEIKGYGGEQRAARKIQSLLRHHEYCLDVFGAVLAEWETRFFSATGELDRGVELELLAQLHEELVGLRRFLEQLDHAQRSIRRRAQNQPGFPEVIREEAKQRCDSLAPLIRELRRDLQAAYAMLTGAAATQQAITARRREIAGHRATIVGSVLAGVVLVPGLVAAFYGADVRGLPGREQEIGLLFMVGASVVGAVLVAGVLLWAVRGRRANDDQR